MRTLWQWILRGARLVLITSVALIIASAAPGRADAAVGGDMTVTGTTPVVTVAAGTLTIDGSANRLLAAAAGVIHAVNAHLGRAYLAGGRVALDDCAIGDLAVAAGEIKINSRIDGTLRAAGGTIIITSDSRVGGSADLAGGDIAVDGKFAGDLQISGGIINVAGDIRGSVRLAGTSVAIASGTHIGGDLIYRSTQSPSLPADIVVHGKITRDSGLRRGVVAARVIRTLALFIATAASGALAVRFAPAMMTRAGERLRNSSILCLAVGAGVGFVMPAGAVLLAATRIGLPLAALVLAATAIAATLGLVIVCREAGALGAAMVSKSQPEFHSWFWATGVFAALAILGLIPVAGPIVLAIVVAAGLGALALAWRPNASGTAPR